MTYIEIIILLAVLLGVIAVLGLYSSRDKKKASQDITDTLRPKTEPVFGTKAAAKKSDSASSAAPVAVTSETLTMKLPDLPPPNEALLESDICYVMHFYGTEPVGLLTFHPLIKQLQLRANFIRALGYDKITDTWQTANDTDKYAYWLFAIPLADRGGMLTREKIQIVEEDAKRAIEGTGIRAVFPPTNEVLETAELLDKFCNDVDMLLELRIGFQAGANTSRGLDAIAMLQNGTQEEKGKYAYRQDSESLFSIIYNPQAGRLGQTITFSLDAPRVTHPEKTFEDMVDYAKRLASVLNGTITDPSGQVVDDGRLANIRQELAVLCYRMNEKDVAPGSPTAKLLFS